MMNAQREMDVLIQYNQKNNIVPKLLLHACCAPCSSYVLEYLSKYFHITVFYYNPNISTQKEYDYRLQEEKRLISLTDAKYPIELIEGNYLPQEFYNVAKGLEKEPERGKRCDACFNLRLEESAKVAQKINADYFATTLTISPLKNTTLINEIGERLSQKYGVKYLPSDFKKKNGYKRSIELSHKFNLYRQNFCGCIYSKPMENS